MKTAEQIKGVLAGCYGTSQYHRVSPIHGPVVLTDGALTLAKEAECFWLIDIIASYQPKCRKDSMLRQMQFWDIKVTGSTAVVTCSRDEGDVVISQKIPFTDFPFDAYRLYVAQQYLDENRYVMVVMLPSEY